MPKVYDITLSIREANSFVIERSNGVSGQSLWEVCHKFMLILFQEMRQEHETEIKELKERFLDDDVPF